MSNLIKRLLALEEKTQAESRRHQKIVDALCKQYAQIARQLKLNVTENGVQEHFDEHREEGIAGGDELPEYWLRNIKEALDQKGLDWMELMLTSQPKRRRRKKPVVKQRKAA